MPSFGTLIKEFCIAFVLIAAIAFAGTIQPTHFFVPQFRGVIVRVLTELDLNSPSAVNLLLGTAAQESGLGTFLDQLHGPARGVFQMEPATEQDLWDHYLPQHPELFAKIKTLVNPARHAESLEWNLAYQIAMTRVYYLRVQEPLPQADDIAAMGRYWKRYYNTAAGKGTVHQFIESYKHYVLRHLPMRSKIVP